MNVRLAVLADGANVAFGNKLNILGAFSAISATSFPAVLPRYVLVVRLELVYEDAGQHELLIEIVDPDHRSILQARKGLAVQRIEPGAHSYLDEILDFSTQFENAGTVSFVVKWDGEEAARVPLHIRLAPVQTDE